MVDMDIPGQNPAERWSVQSFLVIGGLWFLSGVVDVVHQRQILDEIAGVHLGTIVVFLVLAAMAGTVVALLGLYSRLADSAPRVALAGISFGSLTAVGNVVVYLTGLLGILLPASGDVLQNTGVADAIVVFWIVGAAVYPVGPTLFGVGTLRTGTLSRAVGYLLVVPVVLWMAVLGTIAVEGTLVDTLRSGVIFLLALDFLTVGYFLHTDATATRAG